MPHAQTWPDPETKKLAHELPAGARKFFRWLIQPWWKWIRIPLALLLIAAGFMGFLPLLGFWLIPLGLVLLAIDMPFLRKPLRITLHWLNQKVAKVKAWWKRQ